MAPRPLIFISAVSKELRSARQLVSNTLQFLGYEPVWQDIFGTEQGDLREMLRRKIDGCKGVVQLVGKCYGAEPPAPDETFGRVSYTQYEAIYARQCGKKVWYLFLDEGFPGDSCEPESEDKMRLQDTYRRQLQSESHLYHPLNSRDALESSVLKLRDDLTRLRRGVKQWAAAVIVLLVVIAGVVVWLEHGQQQESRQLTAQNQNQQKQLQQQNQQIVALEGTVTGLSNAMVNALMQFAGTQSRIQQSQPQQSAADVQEATYQVLAKQLGVDPNVLKEKLPEFARELQTAPNATAFERANAAFVAKNYDEAERLALVAADDAQSETPQKTADAIKALDLAGQAANARIQYADAMQHYRAAARLTDQSRDVLQWAGQQWHIAYVLEEQGQYTEAEKMYGRSLAVYEHARSNENKDVFSPRNNLALVYTKEGKYAEAEAELRNVLNLEEKVLGADNPESLDTRDSLALSLRLQGKFADAEAEDRSLIKREEKVLGPTNVITLWTRSNLAIILSREGKDTEAESEDRTVLQLREKTLGPENPDTLSARDNLGIVLNHEGKYAAAENEFRTSLQLLEKVLGPEHPDTLETRGNLAMVLRHEGEYAQAEAEDRSLLLLEDKVLGPEHPDTLAVRANLALVLNDEGKHAAAELEDREVLQLQEKVLGPANPDTLGTRNNLTTTLEKEGKYAEAVETEQETVTIAQAISDERARQIALLEAYLNLSWQQLLARDFTGALASAESGHKLNNSDLYIETNRAHALLFLGRVREAEAVYLQYSGKKMNPASGNSKTWNETILQDFDDLEKTGLTNSDFPHLRQLLKTSAS